MEKLSYHLLLSTQSLGLFATLLLFLFCFLGVHIVKLAQIGWLQSKPATKKQPAPDAKPTEKEKTAPVPEPVYYIVERKKTRAKPTYGEPKKISFK